MSEQSQIPNCDNLSVGVIIENQEGEIVLLERGRFPYGFAPPAGHGDAHGSLLQTAVEEVSEEVGLTLHAEDLQVTAIEGLRVANRCRRPGGDYHDWTVYQATEYEGEIVADTLETRGAQWHPRSEVQSLADRTSSYLHGEIEEQDWQASPGLEPVWRDFLSRLGYVS